MKSIIVFLVLVNCIAYAQPYNSYPAAGNIKVFATDETWSEGIAIIKATGWSGIRLARNNPTSNVFQGNWALGYNINTGNDFSFTTYYNGTQYDGILHISNSTRNVGIGTTSPDEKLTVNGKIKAEEIQVVVDVPADYVFEEDYDLMPLKEVEQYLQSNKHLPGLPDAKSIIDNGWQVGEMNNKLLEKIEELTLYVIQLQKENEEIRKLITK